MTAQQFLQRKWIVPILRELSGGTKRFGELHKTFKITRTTLSQRLKLLEHEGFIKREIFAEVPPRVEYSLTEIGKNYIEYLKGRDKID